MSEPERSLLSQQISIALTSCKDGLHVLRHRGPSQVQFWFIALVIGIGAGFAALFFRKGINSLQAWLYGTEDVQHLHSFASSLPWYLVLLIPVAGGLIVGVILTTFTTVVAILGSFNYIKKHERAFYALMLLMETGVIGVFIATDLFLFYVFFEAILIPVYFMIGRYGTGQRAYAAVKFLIYSLAGGLVMLAALAGVQFVPNEQTRQRSLEVLISAPLHSTPPITSRATERFWSCQFAPSGQLTLMLHQPDLVEPALRLESPSCARMSR